MNAALRSSRRSFLAAGGAIALGGCAHCKFPAQSAAPKSIGDAHAHFFNAADLPIAGFAKYVLIPRYFPELPDFALALVDIIAFVAKALTLTATQEARQLGRGSLSFSDPPDPKTFGRVAARAHRIGLRGEAPLPEVDELEEDARGLAARSTDRAASHRALAELLGGQRSINADAGTSLSAEDFANIATGDGTSGLRARDADELQCPESGTFERSLFRDKDTRTLLKWAYLMCQSRCVHVEAYLKAITIEGARVADAINLFVDYDKWLNDSPRSGSRQDAQVAYWTRYSDISASVPDRIHLHNFAGYDPLRDAEERILGGGVGTTFETMKQWALAGRDPASRAPRRVAGFKIYPPMGFRPDSNAVINIPPERGGKAIHRRWGEHFPEIGAEIDRSLNAFFRFCVETNIPILTHARESNIAFAGHGYDASPHHWLRRAAMLAKDYPGHKPLRVCIGHFDMISCPGTPTDSMVLAGALAMNQAKKARFYFDVGFDDRILDGNGTALFDEIGAACSNAGDEGDYILFGTDWIMLANQSNADRYLELAYRAALASRFWENKLDKLFRTNLQRFLDPAAD